MVLFALACSSPPLSSPSTPPSDPSPSDGQTPPASETGAPSDPTGDPGDPVASAGCGQGAGEIGSFDATLPTGGEDRHYLLEVPPAHDGVTPLPLVVDLHGTFADAGIQRLLSGLDRAARDDGFVAVWPDSLSPGGVKAFLLTCQSNDVTFVDDLLDHLEDGLCIDKSRVVITGVSNGGYFANILGSVLGPRIAAIAPVAGGTGAMPILCRPAGPETVTIVHGTADDVVPFSEGLATRDFWTDLDDCPTPVVDAEGCETSGPCDDGTTVRFCAAEDAGHVLIYAEYPTAERVRELVAGL